MTLSSLIYAVYYILFDIALRNSSYNSCTFWLQIGLLIMGIVLLCIKRYRITFIKAIKENGKKYLALNMTNEALNLVCQFLVHFANLAILVAFANLAIPVALVNVLNGFQGAFVFILGVLGTLFIPKYIKEDITKSVVIQKILSIVFGIIGLIILMLK